MTANLITVMVNGEKREAPGGSSVDELLRYLGIGADRVAIERNLEILPRAEWALTQVQPDDRFEIVHFVGGG